MIKKPVNEEQNESEEEEEEKQTNPKAKNLGSTITTEEE